MSDITDENNYKFYLTSEFKKILGDVPREEQIKSS